MSGRRLTPALVALLAAGPAFGQTPAQFRLDADRLQFDRVTFDGRLAGEDANRDEFGAYCDTLLHARQFPAGDLIAAGDQFTTYRDLVGAGGKAYQFQLLTMELRLKVARPFAAPKPLAEQGVPTLYECWLFPPRTDDPVCLVVSELPAGLDPALAYPVARPVTVAGYFFKRVHYDSQIPDPARPGTFHVRRAPLLLGHSFALAAGPPVAPSNAWVDGFLPGVLGLVGLVAAAAVGLTWHFRRGDRAVRAELAARRARNPFEEGATDE